MEPSLFNNYYPINFRPKPNFEILNIFIGLKVVIIKKEVLFNLNLKHSNLLFKFGLLLV